MVNSRKYDLVIPMGQSCSCTQALRVAGLQWLTFPFDWVGGPTCIELIRIMEDGFKDWMNLGAFMHIGDRRHPQGRIYRNVETELIYSHEVPFGSTLQDVYESMSKKYARRIRRLKKLLRNSKSILAVRMSVPGLPVESDEELRMCQQRLSNLCKNASIDLLYLVNRPGCHEAEERKVGEHILVVELDYGEKGVTHPNPLAPDINALERYLGRYSCRDYRSVHEKRSHNAKKNYRQMFGIATPLPPPPNKVWNYGPKAFEMSPLTFSTSFKENNRFRQEFDESVKRVLDTAVYVNGEMRDEFEKRFAAFVGAGKTVACASFHEALRLVSKLLSVDEEELPSLLFRVRNCPLSEVRKTVDRAIKKYGFALLDLSEMVAKGVCQGFCRRARTLCIFSFNDQSNMPALGNLSCVSFPGDVTLAEDVVCGDELQCALANVKLTHVDDDNARRGRIARRYLKELCGNKIILPKKHNVPVWSSVPVMVADETIDLSALWTLGVSQNGPMLDLPTSPGLSNAQIGAIISILNGGNCDSSASR